MGMSQEEKERSHARIVASAARLFRARGLQGASVADVMHDAGLTHGGFYKHFASKDALAEAAVDAAFAEFADALDRGEPARAVAEYRARYLSREHLDHPEVGCPAAALGQEAARTAESVKARFGAGVKSVVDRIARGLAGSPKEREAEALRAFAQMVGAIVVARACDAKTAEKMLSACRAALRAPGERS